MDTAELRPYYNEDTFDAGYLVKFNPQKGVVDSNGFNIASKLSIVKNSNSSAKNLDPATLFTTRSNSKGSLFNFSLNFGSRAKALKGSSGSLDSLVKEFEWVDLLNVNKWIAVVSQLMELFVRKYFQLLIQQPFEVSRLLQQVGQFSGESVSHTEEQKKARHSGIILSDLDNEDEINYFPSTSTPDLLRDGTDNDERDNGEDQYTGRYRSACGWGEFSLEVQLYLSPCAFCCAGRRQLEKWARHPLYLLLRWYICGVRVLVFLYYQMNRHCRPRCIPPTVKYM